MLLSTSNKRVELLLPRDLSSPEIQRRKSLFGIFPIAPPLLDSLLLLTLSHSKPTYTFSFHRVYWTARGVSAEALIYIAKPLSA